MDKTTDSQYIRIKFKDGRLYLRNRKRITWRKHLFLYFLHEFSVKYRSSIPDSDLFYFLGDWPRDITYNYIKYPIFVGDSMEYLNELETIDQIKKFQSTSPKLPSLPLYFASRSFMSNPIDNCNSNSNSNNNPRIASSNWKKNKKNIALFRGSPTGDSQMILFDWRLTERGELVSDIAELSEKDSDVKRIFDVKYVCGNMDIDEIKVPVEKDSEFDYNYNNDNNDDYDDDDGAWESYKICGNIYTDVKLGIEYFDSWMKNEDIVEYKYLINIDGNSVRDGFLNSLIYNNQIILKHSSYYKEFWYHDLINYKHLIYYTNTSDIVDKMKIINHVVDVVERYGNRNRNRKRKENGIASYYFEFYDLLVNITVNSEIFGRDYLNQDCYACFLLHMLEMYNYYLFDSSSVVIEPNIDVLVTQNMFDPEWVNDHLNKTKRPC